MIILGSYIWHRINKIRQSQFVLNLATLSLGTIIAQVVPFVATFILSRLYLPEEMGEWGVFSSYASILAIIATLRFDGAIVKSGSKTEAYNLTYISLLCSFIYVLILYIIIFFFTLYNIDLGLQGFVLYLLPLYVLVLVAVQVFTNLSTYLKEYKLNAKNSIERSVFQALSRIALGFLKAFRSGMSLGAFIGGFITVVSFAYHLDISKNRKLFSTRRSKILIHQNLDFLKFDLPSNLLNSISSHCPPILLAYYFTDYVVGLFSMALTLLYMPMAVVGYSVSQLYYKEASVLFQNGRPLTSLTRRLFISLFIFGIIFACTLIIIEDWFFGFVLGNKWNDVGDYVALLSSWLLFVTCFSPLSTVFYVKKEQRINMNLNIAGLFIRIISIVFGALIIGASSYTILLFSLSSTVFCMVQGAYILKFGDFSFVSKDIYLLGFPLLAFIILYTWKMFEIL